MQGLERGCHMTCKVPQTVRICSGEDDKSKSVIVGGAAPDYGMLVVETSGSMPKLGKEHLAQVHACSVLKHIDNTGGCYEIQQVPRRKITDSVGELEDLAKTLSACVAANHGVPPLLLAMDAHESFTLVHSFCLGVLPVETYSSLPVLGDCVPTTCPKIPCFGFRYMVHTPSGQPLLGCLDPKHLIKAWARSLRSSSRIVRMFLGLQQKDGYGRQILSFFGFYFLPCP